MNNQKFFDRPFVIPAITVGVALIIGLWVLGVNIANRGVDNTIVVTGSARADVTSDEATWQIDVRRDSDAVSLASAYSQLSSDATTVKSYLNSLNLASSSVTGSVISTDENYNQDSNAPKSYSLHETVTIQTTDVQKIDDLSQALGDLSAKISFGTRLMPQQPQYYISMLPQLRVSLLGDAVKDARARATSIAESGSTKVGALESASSGVVQVLAPNSTDVEDYGSYDTSTIPKQVMVIARATFYVK